MSAPEIGMQDVLRILDGLGTSLFTVRVMRGLSQREVARQAGESFSTVCRVEKGADCNLSTARALLAWIATNPTEEAAP